jgi:eukaryotic-like serine/threonine-protein kinase
MGPAQIGPYEVLAPLGSGGMGEVFLAQDTRLRRKVAIKRVRPTDRLDAQRQILREARTVALLSHPNIAGIFDIVDEDGVIHIVMEYVEGETLAAKLRAGPLAPPEALGYVRQIADALAYAHGQGIIHCDVKPSNVMITPTGRARVLDFGIARFEATLKSDSDQTTSSNVLRGTPLYMAPEVLLGAQPSTCSDVYSLGIVLFELITARRPYEGLAPARILEAASTPVPALSDAVPTVSRDLSDLVSRAITADPQRRISSVDELKTGLDAIANATATTPRPRRLTFDWRWATPAIVLIAGSLALLTGIPRRGSVVPSRDPSVIAVMIFNTTGDEKNDYLGAGLTDSLIASLAAAPRITAVPRTTVLPYLAKAGDLSKPIRDLRLTHVLTGGVQRSDTQVRYTMNLLDGDRTLLWSGVFDGAVSDLMHLEQRIADATLQALRARAFVTADVVAQARSRPPTSNPDAFEAYSHGRVLLDRSDVPGNIDRALSLFENAIRLDPKFVRAHAAIGETAWLKYRATRDRVWIDRARASTIDALRLAPDDPSVLYSLAVIDNGTGHPDQAIADLERVLRMQPSSDDAHRLLGRIYSDRGDFPRAIEELREALKIRPEYPATLRALGLAYYEQGKLDDAIAVFTKLTGLQPDNAAAFQMLGTAYHKAGQFDQAIVAYERSNTLAPKSTAFANIGILHHARGDYAGAISAYRQSLRLQPKEAATHRNLGDALWMAGDRAGARAEYQKAIHLATEALSVNAADARTHALIAFCEAKLGHAAASQRSLKEALRLAPNDAEIVYKQAVIETLGRNFDAGLTTLQRAVQLGYSAKMLATDHDLDPLRNLAGFPAAR